MPPSRRAAAAPPPTSPRPTLTIFDASQAVATDSSSSRALVRFQVSDAARRVRVRLAFVSLAGDGTKRVNLGGAARAWFTRSGDRSRPGATG